MKKRLRGNLLMSDSIHKQLTLLMFGLTIIFLVVSVFNGSFSFESTPVGKALSSITSTDRIVSTTTSTSTIDPTRTTTTTTTPPCGDNICEKSKGENSIKCPTDCGLVCGDGVCYSIEDKNSCPADCSAICGNSACELGEKTSCPQDCDAVIKSLLPRSILETTCGNNICDSSESFITCPFDCGCPVTDPTCELCGNGVCGLEESSAKCPIDCGVKCGDRSCYSPLENSNNCALDCGGLGGFTGGVITGAYSGGIGDPNAPVIVYKETQEPYECDPEIDYENCVPMLLPTRPVKAAPKCDPVIDYPICDATGLFPRVPPKGTPVCGLNIDYPDCLPYENPFNLRVVKVPGREGLVVSCNDHFSYLTQYEAKNMDTGSCQAYHKKVCEDKCIIEGRDGCQESKSFCHCVPNFGSRTPTTVPKPAGNVPIKKGLPCVPTPEDDCKDEDSKPDLGFARAGSDLIVSCENQLTLLTDKDFSVDTDLMGHDTMEGLVTIVDNHIVTVGPHVYMFDGHTERIVTYIGPSGEMTCTYTCDRYSYHDVEICDAGGENCKTERHYSEDCYQECTPKP